MFGVPHTPTGHARGQAGAGQGRGVSPNSQQGYTKWDWSRRKRTGREFYMIKAASITQIFVISVPGRENANWIEWQS